MPRGSSPGERRGGRPKGAKNKVTLEKALASERIIAEQQGRPGRTLGKEIVEEFAVMFAGLAASFQPTPAAPGATLSAEDMEAWARSYKEPLFEKYAKLAAKCASDFADFQSPRMGTVQVPAPAPEQRGQVKKRFTINIFDSQGRPAPRHINVEPTPTSATRRAAPAVPLKTTN
jgi:hypothetical protein